MPKKKLLESAPEPHHVDIFLSSRTIDLYLSAVVDFCRCELPERSVLFRDTLMFQTRIHRYCDVLYPCEVYYSRLWYLYLLSAVNMAMNKCFYYVTLVIDTAQIVWMQGFVLVEHPFIQGFHVSWIVLDSYRIFFGIFKDLESTSKWTDSFQLVMVVLRYNTLF